MDTRSATTAVTEVRNRIDSWTAAVRRADIAAIMSHYAPDVLAFDAIQQLQFKGVPAYEKHWKACLEMCPGPMVFEVHELDVQVEGPLAVAHALMRCGASDESGETKTSWMRMTSSYRKIDGQWMITHEHFSAPFDMQTGKALFDLQPDGSADKVRPIPLGMNTVTPHLVCAGAAQAIEFYKKAFGATEESKLESPDGKIAHACVRIGGSPVMLVDEMPQWGAVGPKTLKGSPVTIHLYVDDAEAVAEKAVAAGATLVMPVQETFWGDRYGVLEDPYGHKWSVATHVRDLSREEIQRGAREMMSGKGGAGATAAP